MTHSAAASAILAGDRRALARAITLVESTRADHRQQADALLAELREHRGRAFRVGITGTPGVGKSTLIEAFGLHLCNDRSLRVAVLAVDPSSPVCPVDDYIDESGRLVFTAAYLLKQGACCGNGCRHCPYDSLPVR